MPTWTLTGLPTTIPLGSSTAFEGPLWPVLSPFGTISGLSTPGCYSPLGGTSSTFASLKSRVGYLCPVGPTVVVAATTVIPEVLPLCLVEGTSRMLDTSSVSGKS